MKATENKNMKAGFTLERTRSTVSTAIMANTEASRQTNSKLSSLAVQEKKKEKLSLLDRLTIVDVESSSSKKKKSRKNHGRCSIPRNDEPPPEELLFRDGHPDSVSVIPDFSIDEGMNTDFLANDPEPVLFTFDLVPSISEDLSFRENRIELGEDNEDNDTTDANIGEDDEISGIFDTLEEINDKYVQDVEEKYRATHKEYSTGTTKERNNSNMETLAALSKLELTSRTRTESTAFLSDVSSNHTSLHMEKESEMISTSSQLEKEIKNEEAFVASEELQVKASRCISFNILSMFD